MSEEEAKTIALGNTLYVTMQHQEAIEKMQGQINELEKAAVATMASMGVIQRDIEEIQRKLDLPVRPIRIPTMEEIFNDPEFIRKIADIAKEDIKKDSK